MYSNPIPCTIEDEMMRLGYLAEESSDTHKLLHDVPVSESIQQWSRAEEVEGWGKSSDVRNMKIVQVDTGEMVAHAQWVFCLATAEDAELMEPEEPEELHPEINRERYIAILRDHVMKKDELMRGKAHLQLTSFMTHPSHRRRGLATRLLEWGIALAEAHNLPIFLISSPSGLSMYQKHGFEAVGEVQLDLTPLSIPDPHINTCMLLPASNPSLPPTMPNVLDFVTVEDTTDPADCTRLVDLEIICFAPSALSRFCFSKPADPIASRNGRAQVYKSLLERKVPEFHLTRAVDRNSGVIIGMGMWAFDTEDPAERMDEQHNDNRWGEGTNRAAANAMFGGLWNRRLETMKGRKYISMMTLVVEPGWERRGVGRKILEWGLGEADKRGYPCFLGASLKGKGLYEKLGWVEQSNVGIDEGDFGGESGRVHVTSCMVREPRP